MQKKKKLYDEYTARTGEGNKPILPSQQIRQWLDQQFEGFEEYDYRLATKQRLEVKSKMEFVANIILEWNLISWQSTGM